MYCYRCGQYALDTEQPFWKYIRQHFEYMYQFDGKIWMTIRLMFTRPGFLTNEFNAGKINSYVHPFRLYMCVSVVFFAIFFMVAGDRTGMALSLNSTRIFPISEGSVVRIAPAGERSVRNNGKSPLFMLCIQYKSGTFTQGDTVDGNILSNPVKW